jgi:hypothetical protein
MQWTHIEDLGKYASIPGMDPRAEWLLGPGDCDFFVEGDDMRIPLILNPQSNAFNILVERTDLGIFISRRQLKANEHTTALADRGFFDDLADREDRDFQALRESLKEIKLGAALPAGLFVTQDDLQDPPIGPPPGGWPDGTAVIGIIDDGIAFAHERFRTASNGARVQCFWRMDPPDTLTGTVEFGHEVWKASDAAGVPLPDTIDDLLAKSTRAGWLDEEEFYWRARLIDFADPGHKGAAWRIAHGAHVLDLAAGEDPAHNVLNRPIIAVQLPTATTRDTWRGGDLTVAVLQGIDYILRRAKTLAGNGPALPVVINFSYGLFAGPHDGTHTLESAIDQRISDYDGPLRVVLPAGNSHLARCHAEVKFVAEQTVDLFWRVQPDDQSPSFVDIWMPHAGPAAPVPSRMTVTVIAPNGTASLALGEANGETRLEDAQGRVLARLSYKFQELPTERGRFLVELQPTARLQPTDCPIAPSGLWTIRLENCSLTCDEPVNLWIERDEAPYGYPIFGRQSYFDQPCYVRYDDQGRVVKEDSDPEQGACYVRRDGSINGIATGELPVVMGSYRRKDAKLARYSAGEPITPKPGETPNPDFRKPDAVAASDDSLVHAGFIAAGSRSGSRVALSGTSMAAPMITRWIADRLAQGAASGRQAVKVLAIDGEPPHSDAPPVSPRRAGWGRIKPWGVARRARSAFEP